AVERACGEAERRVAGHGHGPEAAVAVAAAVVEAHGLVRMLHAREHLRLETAAGLRPQVPDAVLEGGDEAALRVQGDAADALGGVPGVDAARDRVEAVQGAALDVDPPQRLLGRRPQRALAELATAGGEDLD